ncbi:MAG: hypothetical protein II913_01065 [Elusimicrobiaceae bacterium]|nr:hypothetical protein [Elusimicrobiaceae bacterium]
MKKHILEVLVLFPILASAQGLEVLHTEIPPTVPFAKPFAAQAILAHGAGDSVQLVKDSTPADFAITHVALNSLAPDRTQADLTVLPLTLNKSTFTVSFALNADPNTVATVETPLTITPVQLFKDNEFKEIRSPKRPFDWMTWLCVLLTLIALICLIIWWIRRLQKDATLLSAEKDNRPAHVIALSQIDALVDSGLWENKQYKLFYITLTDILRAYLQKAFGLDVSADTSAELLRRIKTQEQFTSFVQGLREFLASGDLVKFAKATPTETTRNQDVTFLRHFITQTAPKPQPQTPKTVEVKI